MRTLLLALLLCAIASAADLSGTWDVEVIADSQTRQAKLRLTSMDGKWSGSLAARGQEYPLKELKTENDGVTFVVDAGDHAVKFTLKMTDDVIEGRWETDGSGGVVKGKRG